MSDQPENTKRSESDSEMIPTTPPEKPTAESADVSNDDTTTDEAVDPRVIVPDLQSKLDPRLALGWSHLFAVGFLAFLFWFLNSMPLRANDLLGHLCYGQWIVGHNTIPTEDPFCPIVEDIPMVDTAWLSQVIYAKFEQIGGLEALSLLYAVTMTAYFLLLMLVINRKSRSGLATGIAIAFVFLTTWSRLLTQRPENFGMLCFALLLYLVIDLDEHWMRRRRKIAMIGVPIVMCLWANLHGSFAIGLVMLAIFLIGRIIQAIAQDEVPLDKLHKDEALQRWVIIFASAVIAACINPYGPPLLYYVSGFVSQSPALGMVLEWQSIGLTTPGSLMFVVSLGVLIGAVLIGKRSVDAGIFLCVVLLAVATLASVRMISWYAPLAGLIIGPQIDFLLRRRQGLARMKRSLAEREARGEIVPSTPDHIRWLQEPLLQARKIAAMDKAKVKEEAEKEAGENQENAEKENKPESKVPPGHSFYISLVCLLLIWIAFALSPISQPIFDRPARTGSRLFMLGTPVELGNELAKNPPKAPVFHPQEWGDYLLYKMDLNFEPFITTNSLHLLTQEMTDDYNAIKQGGQNALDLLEKKYDIQTVMLNGRAYYEMSEQEQKSTLMYTLINSGHWDEVYRDKGRDGIAIIYVRRQSSGGIPIFNPELPLIDLREEREEM